MTDTSPYPAAPPAPADPAAPGITTVDEIGPAPAPGSTRPPALFADAIRPAAIPESFSLAAGYADGAYMWPERELARFVGHILISATGIPLIAERARCLDVERFDATPEMAPDWCRARFQTGHNDALIYCSASLVPAVADAMRGVALPWRLWTAWWDNRGTPPSRAEVLAKIASFGRPVEPFRLWACQWHHGDGYDTSVLYAPDDFTRAAR